MTSDLVVRYDEAARASTEQTLRKLVRTQGIVLVILGILWGLITVLPFAAAAIMVGGVDAAFVLGAAALMTIPVAMGALGVR